MKESLKKRTFTGVKWSIIDNIGSRGVTFIVGIILARLLSPKEYGLIGIVTVFITLFNCIVDSGFSQALIRQKEIEKTDFNTVFIINIIVSLFLMIIFIIIAPFVSSFYDTGELTTILRIMSIIIVLYSLSIVQRSIIIRNIDFKKQTIISLSSSTLSGIIGISLALKGYGVWSLVYQQIGKYAIDTALLWFVNKWRPSRLFSFNRSIALFNFGWKITIVNLLDAAWHQIVQGTIGKSSIVSLGYYTRSNQFSSIFSQNLVGVLNRVTYPVLSKIQDEKERLLVAYTNVYRITAFVCGVNLSALAAMSNSLVITLLGEKWLAVAKFIPILCLSSFFLSIHLLHMNIVKTKGDSKKVMKYDIFRKLLLTIPLFISLYKGLEFFLWGEVVVGMLIFLIDGTLINKLLGYNLKKQISDLKNTFIFSILFVVPIFLISFINQSYYSIFIIQLGTTILLFVLLIWIKPNKELETIKNFLFK